MGHHQKIKDLILLMKQIWLIAKKPLYQIALIVHLLNNVNKIIRASQLRYQISFATYPKRLFLHDLTQWEMTFGHQKFCKN